jgi:hypothetical protein
MFNGASAPAKQASLKLFMRKLRKHMISAPSSAADGHLKHYHASEIGVEPKAFEKEVLRTHSKTKLHTPIAPILKTLIPARG